MFGEGDPIKLLQQARDCLASMHTGTPENALREMLDAVAAIPSACHGGHHIKIRCDVLPSMVPRIKYALSQPVDHVARKLMLAEVGRQLDKIEHELTGRYV